MEADDRAWLERKTGCADSLVRTNANEAVALLTMDGGDSGDSDCKGVTGG